MRRPLTALLIACAHVSPPLAVQRLPAPLFARSLPAPPAALRPADDFDSGKAVGAGVLGTVGGLIAGGIMAHQFDGRCESCVAFGLLGAFVGASVGSPLAIHLSNRRRGRLGPAILASMGLGLVGTMAAAGAVHDPRILLVVPVLQIASATAIERGTAATRNPAR